MKFTNITGNGSFSLTAGPSTNSQEATIYAPTVMGGSVFINYLDSSDSPVPYIDGEIFAGEQKRIRCGMGVKIVAVVTGFTATFDIGYAG